MVAAVLAGGLGTRLRSVVSDRPKVMALVQGRPFLEVLLKQLEGAGVTAVTFCTGYLSDQIREHFGERWGRLLIAYSQESQPLGTAGALRLALSSLKSESVLVLNGDSNYAGPLTSFLGWHTEKKAAMSILLTKVMDTSRYGRVDTARSGEVLRFHEKDPEATGPGWVNAGIYVIQRRVIEAIPAGRAVSLEREVFPSWVGRGLLGFRGEGRFLDIGTPESYAQASEFFRSGAKESACG